MERNTHKNQIFIFWNNYVRSFTEYPPYYNIPHDNELAIKICYGLRPKIRCEIPQLLLNLMNKCLDTDPQNQPTASKLANTLNCFFMNLKNKKLNYICKFKILKI